MSIGKQALMAVTGLSAGVGVAGGLFALMIALGLVSEFADQTRTARYISGMRMQFPWGLFLAI